MQTKAPWYKSRWGIVGLVLGGLALLPLLVLALPFGVAWYTWKKTGWPTSGKVAATIAASLFTVVVFAASGQNQPSTSTQSASKHEPAKTLATPPPTEKPKPTYPVVHVVDGDTIDVSINGKTERVRLIGIDTPETVDPRKTVQCFGKEASDKAKATLSGKSVQLEADPTQGDRDKYSRLLRYVFLPDGKNFNKLMIAEGYAHEYTYNTPYKYQTEFKKAETDARNGDKGLWSPTTCAGDTSSAITDTASAPAVSAPTASTGDKDCKDFASHAEAQAYFNAHGGSAANNVDRLDGNDHDGIVCESLP